MVSGSLLAVVAGVLTVGGIAKLSGPEATVPMLRALGLPARPLVARLLGALEVVVGVAALLLGGRILAIAVAVLFAAFTVAVLRLRAGGETVSCGCFGRSSAPPTLVHAAVDGAAVVIAVAAAVADAPGLLDLRSDTPGAGVPLLVLTALAVWLTVAVLTVLPETLVAARRVPAADAARAARALRTFTVESPVS
ncbi:MAG TPA: MauE/DoxX family redox-associated membrane protein [Acidimicrobiales bacterium]